MARETRRFRRYVRAERRRARLYRALAGVADDDAQREVLAGLAEAEERHARHWERRLGHAAPPRPGDEGRERPGPVSRVVAGIAARFGVPAVLPVIERVERAEIRAYTDEPEAPQLESDERIHARALTSLSPGWRVRLGHSVRAGVFGINDGLVSNLSLVMGVAGAQADSTALLITGIAGLLSGSLSMAAGELVSVTSQRELLLSEVQLQSSDLARADDDAPHELHLLPEAEVEGPRPANAPDAPDAPDTADAPDAPDTPDAAGGARRAHESEPTGDSGLIPRGTAVRAAMSNGGAFAVGAVVPVAPFAVLEGMTAVLVAVTLSSLALFLVGATLSLLTARSAWFAGLRQLAIGAIAATATFAIGSVIGGLVQ